MWSKYFDQVLGEAQRQVWRKLGVFADDFYLAGGTALALQIGHRRSYDFDFFRDGEVGSDWRQRVVEVFGEVRFTLDTKEQLTWIGSDGVKITLAKSKQKLLDELVEMDGLKLESMREIVADKAFVLGRRGQYRDYVDVYFCLKQGVELGEVIDDATRKYKSLFAEKLFLEQLVYLEDLPELVVEYVGEAVPVDEVKSFLMDRVKDYVRGRK